VNAALPPGSQLLGLRVLVGTVLVMSAGMFAAKVRSRGLHDLAPRSGATWGDLLRQLASALHSFSSGSARSLSLPGLPLLEFLRTV
jgi:hypothetical protein